MKTRILFPVLLSVIIAAITLPVAFAITSRPSVSSLAAFSSIAVALGMAVSPLWLIIEVRRWFSGVKSL